MAVAIFQAGKAIAIYLELDVCISRLLLWIPPDPDARLTILSTERRTP
jgi:hypothetical protein